MSAVMNTAPDAMSATVVEECFCSITDSPNRLLMSSDEVVIVARPVEGSVAEVKVIKSVLDNPGLLTTCRSVVVSTFAVESRATVMVS